MIENASLFATIDICRYEKHLLTLLFSAQEEIIELLNNQVS